MTDEVAENAKLGIENASLRIKNAELLNALKITLAAMDPDQRRRAHGIAKAAIAKAEGRE